MTAATTAASLGAGQPSIVIITMNRADELDRTLDLLARLAPGPPFTVVVDNGSIDNTREVLRRHSWVHDIGLDENLGGAGRNLGVEAVDSEFVAFIDDDTWPEPDALAKAVGFLRRHPDVALVAAHVLVGDDDRVDPVCVEMASGAMGRLDGGFRVAGFLAGASVVRADALRAVGGFHPAFGVGGEEELVAWDLLDQGWSLVYLPEVVFHHHPSPQRDATARRTRESRNRIWAAWMRRSARDAARRTVTELHAAVRTGTAVALTRAVARGLPMVVAERRRVTHATEELLRSIER